MHIKKLELTVTQTDGALPEENATPCQWRGKCKFTHNEYCIKQFGDDFILLANEYYEGVYGSFKEAEKRINILHGVATRNHYGQIVDQLVVFLKVNEANKITINANKNEASIKGYKNDHYPTKRIFRFPPLAIKAWGVP